MRVQQQYVTSGMRGADGAASGNGFGATLTGGAGLRRAPAGGDAGETSAGIAECRLVPGTGVRVAEAGEERTEARPMVRLVERQFDAILADENAINDAIGRAEDGEALGRAEMLQLQARVYAHSQRVDVATRVIDRTASALRQLLNTQL